MNQLKTNKISSTWLLVIGVALLLLAAGGLYLAFSPNSDSNSSSPPPPQSGGTAILTITPAKSNVTSGSNLSLQIWENSYDKTVNAVQANLTYDSATLTFTSIDASNSAFSIEAVSKGGGGSVTIGRGQTNPLSGNQLVATVNFKVAGTSGRASVNFSSSSKIASATSHNDILAKAYGGIYTIQP